MSQFYSILFCLSKTIYRNMNLLSRRNTHSVVKKYPTQQDGPIRKSLYKKEEKSPYSKSCQVMRKFTQLRIPREVPAKRELIRSMAVRQFRTRHWKPAGLPQLCRTNIHSQMPQKKKRQLTRKENCLSYSLKNDFGSFKERSLKPMKVSMHTLKPLNEDNREKKTQKFKIIRSQYQFLINTSNMVTVRNNESVFRACVGKGNNSFLVKQILKKRWWWFTEQKNPAKANLVWSQWCHQPTINRLNEALTTQQSQRQKQDPMTRNQISLSLEPKIKHIQKICDDETFSRIRESISNHAQSGCYLKTYFQRNSFSESSSIKNIQESTEKFLSIESKGDSTIHNHIDGCLQLHSKTLMFKNVFNYLQKSRMDPFQYLPLTFYIQKTDSPALEQLQNKFQQLREKSNCANLWIVKPGENSNRGHGISIHSSWRCLSKNIKERLTQNQQSKEDRTIIVQKYIEDCFLIKKRKFDIRCYLLITTVNGIMKGYWYQDGYIRTSSQQYSFKDVRNLMVHLTNDAIQKKGVDYGKFQDCNKMSFATFQNYLDKNGNKTGFESAYSQMKQIAYYLIASVASKIKRKQYSFELFGLDFLLDRGLKPYLIEANSNPCLDSKGLIMGKLIHELIDNVLMTAVDPLFPCPEEDLKGRSFGRRNKELLFKDYFKTNKFELIYTQKNGPSKQ